MAAREEQVVIAFDLYGTLLSTESIAEELASHFGREKAMEVAALWRRYQLEYTWRLNSMKQYQPFSLVTRSSLKHVLKELSLPVDDQAIEKLMEAYDSLSIFSDVALALETIAKTPWIIPVVFSNGTYDMVRNSLYSSPDLSPYASVFKEIVSVDDVKCFKPSPNVYYHLAEQLGKSKEDMGSMWLISGNPFDVVGARAVGMQAAWVNRGGGAWVDEMAQGTERGPTIVISGLGEVLNGVKELTFG